MKKWIVSIVFCAFALPAFAQEIVPESKFVLNVDYARFRNTVETNYLEVYYSFFPRFLTFNHTDGKFHAGVNLTTVLIDSKTDRKIVERHDPIHIAEEDTSQIWFQHAIITQAGFEVPPGKFILQVSAIDSITPNRGDSVRLEIESIKPSIADSPLLSDLQLCSVIRNSTNEQDLFYKNALEVVPFPPLVFGSVSSPILYHYGELHNIKPAKSYQLTSAILNSKGDPVREKHETREYSAQSSVVVGSHTVTSLPSGQYTLRYTVSDKDDHLLASSQKVFYILNPHIQAPALSDSGAITTRLLVDLSGLSDKELSHEFRVAQYYSNKKEQEIYATLDNTNAKRQFLAAFWERIELGQTDKPPITRDQYLRRLKFVEDQFSSFGRDGWRTDRGRVFLVYGPPDERERFPAESSSKAYEIWRYHTLDSGVEFVFVDRTGFREFQLVHSTKRGEMHDENWAQYLR